MEDTTEQERAAFYHAHKDDPDLWEPADPPTPRRGRPSRGLSATITVRFTPEEAAIIRREAQETGATYSEVVRRAVRARAPSQAPDQTAVLGHLIDPAPGTQGMARISRDETDAGH